MTQSRFQCSGSPDLIGRCFRTDFCRYDNLTIGERELEFSNQQDRLSGLSMSGPQKREIVVAMTVATNFGALCSDTIITKVTLALSLA